MYYMSLILTYFWAKKKLNTIFRPLRCFRKKLTGLTLHSLMTWSSLNYVPVHVFPLPVYPSLQTQRYEPIVLLHCAFTWQVEGEELHSFMSETDINNISIKLNMKYYMLSRQSLESGRREIFRTEMTDEKVERDDLRISWFSANA